MFIRHNISALNTTRQLGLANKGIQKNTERLSTGFQINRAGDDAAGLSISEKMRGQISGSHCASSNTNDSISLVQTAEGALTEVNSILIRGRELAVQAANDTNTDEDRAKLQVEWRSLKDKVNRIGSDTEFNTRKLLDGSNEDGLRFQLGANSEQNIVFTFKKISTTNLAIDDTTIDTQQNANDAILFLDKAAVQVSTQRSELGAVYNRLGHSILNNDQTGANLTSADTIIRDANMAFEVMGLTKNEILRDTMQSALTHANIKNDPVLNLLN